MNPFEPDPKQVRLDRAVSNRLAKLRNVPVDLTALRRAVEARLPKRREGWKLRWLSPMRAAAASLLIVGTVVALVIASSSGPALASAERLGRIHEEVVSGVGHRTQVNSIEAANAALSAQHPGAPRIPDVPDDHVMSCCVHTIGRKKMSCVSVMADGVPLTLAVADAADIKLPECETQTVDGIVYHVQSSQGVNMAMSQRNGRWSCLMGKLPASRLIKIAKTLQF